MNLSRFEGVTPPRHLTTTSNSRMEDRTEEFRHSEHTVRPEDVASPAATVEAVYDVISGPPNTERDWERLRSLFDRRARFVIGRWIEESGETKDRVCEWDLEGFIEQGRTHWLEAGFWESELTSQIEQFGNVAQVFSSYESRVESKDSDPVMRGVNSVQLLQHGGRWWIIGIVWDVETPENPLPDDLGE